MRFQQLLVLLIAVAVCSCKKNNSHELSTENALSTFQIEEGFKIELLASEPLIGDPVDMEIDEFGRLYVVDMPGYPLDISGSGSIKLLSDTNGDGVMDKSTLFAENLVLPNSVMRWKNGVIVTDAPNVLYLEDTNGDDRADVRDTLLTGFALSNPQHNLNSPILAIDNWIYLAHEGIVSTETYSDKFGDTGGEIHFTGRTDSPRLPRNASGRSVRFNPDDSKLEELSSNTQFGHTFDEWGNHLLVGNANHVYHEVIAQRYLSRNPALMVSDATQSISDHGNAAEVFPTTQNPQHQLLTDIGVITSACGLIAYLGAAFPPPYNDDVTFVAEPVNNLIHVDQITEKGATFSAARIKPNREFLTSSDAKFRPVNLYVGPDGSLYVVDYYRQIIEHPEWMGKEVVESGELYNDRDKGRIYRISKNDAPKADWTNGLTFGNASDKELVSRLADPNSWWRQTAQRLLVDRNSPGSVAFLDEMLKNANAMGRLHALWTLQGMKQLRTPQIENALRDAEDGVRENAIKLAELHRSESPALANSLFTMKSDPAPRVRFQLLITLGSLDSKQANEIRWELLRQDIADSWVRIAALSASSNPRSLAEKVMKELTINENNDRYASLLEELVGMMVARQDGNTAPLLLNYTREAEEQKQFVVQAAILGGIARALQHNSSLRSFTPSQFNAIVQTFFDSPSPKIRKASLNVIEAIAPSGALVSEDMIKRALKIATDRKQPEDIRMGAIDFVAVQNPTRYEGILRKLFIPQEPLPVQLAALRAMSAIPDTRVCQYLLKDWQLLTPQLQDAAVKTFLVDDKRIEILLSAIEGGKILESTISWPRRVRLMTQRNEILRDRSRTIFTKNNEADVNKEYQKALMLEGTPGKGKIVFTENCSICHQVRGTGGIVIGPDLGTVYNWSPSAIMAHTLDPNLSISSGFDLWSVELNSGETVQGIIASESPGAVTLRNIGAKDKTINRSEIKSINALNTSIMPIGLNEQISQEQMADLLAFLKKVN